jgi:cobalt-precorrin-5B (C1)-methyltransferase
MVKLGQGLLDLHSKRGSVDLAALAERAAAAGATAALVERIRGSNTSAEALAHANAEGLPLGDVIAAAAWQTAAAVISGTGMELEVVVFDRDGQLVGRAPFAPAHDVRSPRNLRR